MKEKRLKSRACTCGFWLIDSRKPCPNCGGSPYARSFKNLIDKLTNRFDNAELVPAAFLLFGLLMSMIPNAIWIALPILLMCILVLPIVYVFQNIQVKKSVNTSFKTKEEKLLSELKEVTHKIVEFQHLQSELKEHTDLPRRKIMESSLQEGEAQYRQRFREIEREVLDIRLIRWQNQLKRIWATLPDLSLLEMEAFAQYLKTTEKEGGDLQHELQTVKPSFQSEKENMIAKALHILKGLRQKMMEQRVIATLQNAPQLKWIEDEDWQKEMTSLKVLAESELMFADALPEMPEWSANFDTWNLQTDEAGETKETIKQRI